MGSDQHVIHMDPKRKWRSCQKRQIVEMEHVDQHANLEVYTLYQTIPHVRSHQKGIRLKKNDPENLQKNPTIGGKSCRNS